MKQRCFDNNELLSQIQIDDLPENIRDIAEDIGVEAAMRIVRRCSGQIIYVPKYESCVMAVKHRRLYDDWKATKEENPYPALAIKYNYTENHTRTLIRRMHSKRMLKQV